MSFRDMFNGIKKIIQNSSDGTDVLNAGYSAMSHYNPQLAAAVQKMPGEIASQVVLSYTNAIRAGQDADAFKVATQTARDALAAYKPPAPTGVSALAQHKLGLFKRSAAPALYDVAAFEKDLAAQPAQPRFTWPTRAAQSSNTSGPSQYDAVRQVYDRYVDDKREVIFPSQQQAKPVITTAPANWTAPNPYDQASSTPWAGNN